MPDHVHMMIAIPPKYAVGRIADAIALFERAREFR